MQTKNQAFSIDSMTFLVTSGNLIAGQKLQDDIAEAMNYLAARIYNNVMADIANANSRAAQQAQNTTLREPPPPEVVAPIAAPQAPKPDDIEAHPASLALRDALNQETAAGTVIHRPAQ